ncbi:TetR family transcriptional regulator [Nonomuraea sp. NPDC049695]|uniref:TetR/AcrR family transcriptional regulator n=1 Tax=Nonomuraea sp. NPDC049695 TaxID=3154734 RepID=UPI00341A99EE
MKRSSAASKSLILAAARERFAAEGYERATIRSIAADAGIDPSMVMRYFGNKERLFAAACEVDLALPEMRAIPRDSVGATLVEAFLSRWEGNETLQILLRTGSTHPSVAERMRSIFAMQLVPIAAAFSGDPAAAEKRAGLASSQILGVALCRFVLEFQPMMEMSRQELVDWVGPTIQRYLVDGDASCPPAGRPAAATGGGGA